MRSILLTGLSPSEEIRTYMLEHGYRIFAPGILTKDEIIKSIKEMDAYIPGGEEIVTKEIIDAGKKLKVISFCGVGYEYYIDLVAASEKNIAITNVPNANSQAVAEFSVSLILLMAKNLIILNKSTKNLQWIKQESFDLSDKTVGIIGMGNIGQRVAKILHYGFGCNILYYCRSRKELLESEIGAKYVSLDKLCYNSDIISLHLPYSAETHCLIDENCFNMMRNHVILINTSRAELVSPTALKDALTQCKIHSAAFDCYYGGCVPKNLEDDIYHLLSMSDDKFVITPHVAYNTPISNRNVEKITFQNIIDIIDGDNCGYKVN